jgi:hypothetical protein
MAVPGSIGGDVHEVKQSSPALQSLVADPRASNAGKRASRPSSRLWKIPPRFGETMSVYFLDIAGLRRANPLLYRCFPLTCARSQE